MPPKLNAPKHKKIILPPIFFIILLKQFAPILKICPHFFQISQSQMGLRKELYGPLDMGRYEYKTEMLAV